VELPEVMPQTKKVRWFRRLKICCEVCSEAGYALEVANEVMPLSFIIP
jgi:hypothetical protein